MTKNDIKSGHVAIDFETYYTTQLSITKMGTYQYVTHPEFDAYMVSIYGPDLEFVGRPSDFDWKRLDGYTLIAHNASFDSRVFWHLQEKGVIPELNVSWICTADMCVYFQHQRNLKGAAKEILGVEMDKGVRENMRGKNWDDLAAMDELKETLAYALDDAKYCYQIWEKLWGLWPEQERWLSQSTRDMAWSGLPADTSKLSNSIQELERLLFEAQQRLPWFEEIDPDTKKPYAVYSKKALAIECRNRGIEPPKSLNRDNPDFIAWEKKYGEEITFPADMQAVGRINKHLQTLYAIRDRIRADCDNISYNLKYWGADATGRWSGDGGFNIQNMPRAAQYGVDVRSIVTARDGRVLLIVDLAQIEARITAWLAQNWDFLNMLKDGTSPYEAHARQTMGWDSGKLKDEDPELYTLAKVRVLQLGYGSGWFKFAETVKLYGQQDILDRPFTKQDEIAFQSFAGSYQPAKANLYPHLSTEDRRQWVNAYIQVDDFRKKNPGITAGWKHYDRLLRQAADNGDDLLFTIPSGRYLRYFRCRHETDGITTATQLGSLRRTFTYGANLFQNAVQATARDVFADMLYRLGVDGYNPIMHVHDEVVIEVDAKEAEDHLKNVIEIMSTPPAWAEQVPLSAEGIITEHYTK